MAFIFLVRDSNPKGAHFSPSAEHLVKKCDTSTKPQHCLNFKIIVLSSLAIFNDSVTRPTPRTLAYRRLTMTVTPCNIDLLISCVIILIVYVADVITRAIKHPRTMLPLATTLIVLAIFIISKTLTVVPCEKHGIVTAVK